MEAAEISIWVAMFGGVISFLSPCVLPLVPAYLCYLAGTSYDQIAAKPEQSSVDSTKTVLMAVFFVLGFSTVFVLLGAAASSLNHLIAPHLDILAQIAGVLIVLFGVHMTGLVRIPILYREARLDAATKNLRLPGAYLLGLAFGFGWTPCIGPILATILAFAANENTVSEGAFLLTIYSLGLGIPFLLAAIMIPQFLGFLGKFRRHIRKVEIGTGVAMIITGVLIFNNDLALIANWMLDVFPFLATVG